MRVLKTVAIRNAVRRRGVRVATIGAMSGSLLEELKEKGFIGDLADDDPASIFCDKFIHPEYREDNDDADGDSELSPGSELAPGSELDTETETGYSHDYKGVYSPEFEAILDKLDDEKGKRLSIKEIDAAIDDAADSDIAIYSEEFTAQIKAQEDAKGSELNKKELKAAVKDFIKSQTDD